MLTLEIHDRTLIDRVTDLLQNRFGGDPERMLAELLRLYGERLSRLEYSGRLRCRPMVFNTNSRPAMNGPDLLLDTNAFIYFFEGRSHVA